MADVADDPVPGGPVPAPGADSQPGASVATLEKYDLTPATPKRKAKAPKTDAEKQAELGVLGLVSFDGAVAEFAVQGTKSTFYKITFAHGNDTFWGDGPSQCTCVDYRVRKHTCKHIKLVLDQLGITNEPQAWPKAVAEQGAAFKMDSPWPEKPKKAEPKSKRKAAPKEAAAPAAEPQEGEAAAEAGEEALAAKRQKGKGKKGSKKAKGEAAKEEAAEPAISA